MRERAARWAGRWRGPHGLGWAQHGPAPGPEVALVLSGAWYRAGELEGRVALREEVEITPGMGAARGPAGSKLELKLKLADCCLPDKPRDKHSFCTFVLCPATHSPACSRPERGCSPGLFQSCASCRELRAAVTISRLVAPGQPSPFLCFWGLTSLETQAPGSKCC